MNTRRISKFLSLVLRHQPEKIGLQLDENGWAQVTDVIDGFRKSNLNIDIDILKEVVKTNNKQRFTFSEDSQLIRANQGHSIDIDLGLKPQIPPNMLYHGTAFRNFHSILATGLEKRNRQHVHLSHEIDTAVMVGKRHGKPVVLKIDAKQMLEDGFKFYLSKNGVWLTSSVPDRYISVSH